MPEVSVIMASYNHEAFVGRAIESVLNQTFDNFEMIIVDDNSPDESVQVISSYRDSRIQCIPLTANRGQFNVTNMAIERSQGKYIAILNSDDIFAPDKLEKQVAFLEEHPHIGAVFTLVQLIDEMDRPFTDSSHFYYQQFQPSNQNRFEWLNQFFYHGNSLCHPSVLIRKRCHDRIGLYDRRFSKLADLDFWVRLCLQEEIAILPEPLTCFRIRENEGNGSAPTMNTRLLLAWEYYQLLRHYLQIASLADYRQIFPESPLPPDPELIPAFIALEALTLSNSHQRLALDVLFECLGDPERAAKLKQFTGFREVDFFKTLVDCDVYNLKKLRALKTKAVAQP